MNIVIHDYAGHPFQTSLSRELARRGHRIWHLYFAQDVGPKGELEVKPDDPEGLDFVPIDVPGSYKKGSMLNRRFNDIAYGKRVGEHIRQIRPDIVISGNTPTDSQEQVVRACQRADCAFVYWVQDFYSIAAKSLLSKKFGLIGHLVGRYYQWLEKRQFRKSAAIVTITRDFVPLAADWSGRPDKVSVIENWGLIDDIPQLPRDNAWAQTHGCTGKFVFLYSGTLGLKHNPELLASLAERFQDRAKIMMVGQGLSIPRLQHLKAGRKLDNLEIVGVQSFADFPAVLASADVLVAIIEKEAGVFSVPSKVQSYLCAGKAILLAAPPENLASKVVADAKAGLVVDPDDFDGLLAAAETLFDSADIRTEMGRNGRAYAERTFDIGSVTDRFERVFEKV